MRPNRRLISRIWVAQLGKSSTISGGNLTRFSSGGGAVVAAVEVVAIGTAVVVVVLVVAAAYVREDVMPTGVMLTVVAAT